MGPDHQASNRSQPPRSCNGDPPPSLLPLFPGANAYEQAFNAQVTQSGCTVHLVDEGMDTGEIIAQKSFQLYPNETLNDFKARGLKVENEFYPIVLDEYLLKQKSSFKGNL